MQKLFSTNFFSKKSINYLDIDAIVHNVYNMINISIVNLYAKEKKIVVVIMVTSPHNTNYLIIDMVLFQSMTFHYYNTGFSCLYVYYMCVQVYNSLFNDLKVFTSCYAVIVHEFATVGVFLFFFFLHFHLLL